ncbi:MAG TPA: RraA family protein [Acetobacteraceae bacterium]|nr:RraA family protein [Acetobacteraceae bacterium]
MTSEETSDRLARCYTGVVHDIMRAMGLRDFTLPPALRPILPNQPMAGPAFTIEGRVDAAADPHETLLAWTGLLSKAAPGHVWVSQPNDRVIANMGELSAETLKNKGVRGCVIDGGIRDVRFLMEMGFQSWARFFTPRDIVGYWLPKAVNQEIRIGDVTIAPGDYIVGDLDGLIRVPRAIVAEVVEKSEVAIGTENLIRKAILQGTDPQQAYLQYGKF